MEYYSQYPEQQEVNLAPMWIGSQGIAIFVHSSYPFTVSFNNTAKRQFCIVSQITVDRDRENDEVTFLILMLLLTDRYLVYLRFKADMDLINLEKILKIHDKVLTHPGDI